MTAVHSAIEDLEQQLARSFALVAAARDALLDSGAGRDSMAAALLDMAEDELSDLRLVRQVKAHVAA
jgi:hypothetical protein